MAGPGLDRILSRTRADLVRRKASRPFSRVAADARRAPPPRNFAAALVRPGAVSLIAEMKKASPSAGLLRAPYDAALVARAYFRGGAAALSVLTEENFFLGCLSDLERARRAVPLPVLRKDFLFDAYQVYESRAAGADAVLLIAAVLRDWELRSLAALTRRLGMTPLVETHDEGELSRVAAAGVDVVGINSRNLKDLSMDPGAFARLAPLAPRDAVVVAESGLREAEDAAKLKKLKVNAMLVGESLLRRRDLESAARRFVEAGR
jgi:indole-3-glycerol phosphate synthase